MKAKVPSVNIGPKKFEPVTHPDGRKEMRLLDEHEHPPIVFDEWDKLRVADGGIYLTKVWPHPSGHEVFFHDTVNAPIREALGLPVDPRFIPPPEPEPEPEPEPVVEDATEELADEVSHEDE